ncbi:MAG: 30S ribosomal protein S17 [Desulfarculaceae bacterium]|nr:30S ribosomal protein S17 [Desulfarculaceae bacterium]MCF8071424.1 30S ribosomal protein S17 [Desulfarculaceae bacterium]MCF8101749.1 30S ribosomal protein S17 [Desulfarculaceae bacterium]
MAEKERGNAKALAGLVVSDKMDKTVVVLVERLVKHPVYKKYVRRRAKFMAHDETNDCRVGDTVLIRQSRPLSRHKRWRVSKVLERVA